MVPVFSSTAGAVQDVPSGPCKPSADVASLLTLLCDVTLHLPWATPELLQDARVVCSGSILLP